MGEASNREAANVAAREALANQKAEGRTLRLTPQQLAVLLVFEAQSEQLQLGANQLGGFLGLKAEGEVLLSAKGHIDRAKERMQAEWARTIQVVDASAVRRLVGP